MARNTCCAEIRRIVEKPQKPVQVDYTYKSKKPRFSKRLAAHALLHVGKKSKTHGEDLISQLPDEILVAILSLLSIKEAGKSSVLSQRWRYLWTFYTGKLEIEYKHSNIYSWQRLHYVSKILKSHHRGSVLDELIIRFPGKFNQSEHIGRWVSYASEKCLHRFELDLSDPKTNAAHFTFPQIDRVLLSHAGGFSSLTCLRLTHVNVAGEVLEHFLATCAFLKQLVVRKSSTLRFLKVSGKGLKLELLEVYSCLFLEILNINADNLITLTYNGQSEGLVITRAPRLSKLMIGGKICSSLNDMPCKNISFIQHLECLKLKLGYQASGDPPISPVRLPKMYYLKHLELHFPLTHRRTLLFYTHLIEACPILSRFTMQYVCSPFDSEVGVPAEFLAPHVFEHGCLKVVELVGFLGQDSEYELAFILLQIAISIEKLIIYPHPLFRHDRLKSVRKQLEVKLPTSAVLVML